MLKTRLGAGALIVVAFTVLQCAPAIAAHLEETEEKIDKDVSPPTGDIDTGNLPVCESDVTQSLTTSIDVTGKHAVAKEIQNVNITSADPACMKSVLATITGTVTFTIVGDPDEPPDAPIAICLAADFQQSAPATGNFIADLTLGGIPPNTPATVIRNPLGSAVTELSFGPEFGTEFDPHHNSFRKQLVVVPGDQLQATLGLGTAAAGSGVGSVHARQSSTIQLDIGPCSVLAPALSWRGVALLVLVLGGLGTLSLLSARHQDWSGARRPS